MAQRPVRRRSPKAPSPEAGAARPGASAEDEAAAAPPVEADQDGPAASAATPLPPPAPPSAQTAELPALAEPAPSSAEPAPPPAEPAAAPQEPAAARSAELEALLEESEMALWDGDRARQERPAIDGVGVEVVLTLGDAVGCALYSDGRHVLDLGLGAHLARKRRSYDEELGGAAREHLGGRRWSRRVHRALVQLRALLRPRMIYVAGDNARRLRGELPRDARLLP